MLYKLFEWDHLQLGEEYTEWETKLQQRNFSNHQNFKWDKNAVEVFKRGDAPHLIGDGSIVCWVDKKSKDRSGHCEWRLKSKHLKHGSYLHLDKIYVWQITMRLLTPERAKRYPDSHITWLQAWGPMSKKRPPFAMQVYKNKWRVQSYGGNPDNPVNHSKFLNMSVGRQWKEWTILYIPSVSKEGKIVVWDGKKMVYTAKGMTAYKTAKGYAGQQRVGCYTPPTEDPCRIQYRKIVFHQIG